MQDENRSEAGITEGPDGASAAVVPISARLVDAYTVGVDPMPDDHYRTMVRIRRYGPGSVIPHEPGDSVRHCQDGTTVVIRTWHEPILKAESPPLRISC